MLRLRLKKTLLEILVLGCWGEFARVYPSWLCPNTYLISGVTRSHVGKSLLKISITDLYAYCIFVEYLRYKVLIYFLCGSFGRNSVLIWTYLPYHSNYNTQGVFQSLLKIYLNDLYVYRIFVESLCYKVLIFCFCGSFGGNILMIWTTLPYTYNSAI